MSYIFKTNLIYSQPEWSQERYFEDRAEEYQRLKDAQSCLDFLQSGGLVNTPELFWSAESGETLVEAIKKKHHEKMWKDYK